MLCLLTTSFNIARFEHENEVRRKALKPEKKWNPTLFGIRNPLCWNPESSTRHPESTSWNPESKTVLDSLTWGDSEISSDQRKVELNFQAISLSDKVKTKVILRFITKFYKEISGSNHEVSGILRDNQPCNCDFQCLY